MTGARYVHSTDGTPLAWYESGTAGKPVIVAVHGYPDDHSVWDGVTSSLDDHFRVISYDVRGAGASGQPAGRDAYRMPLLIDDLVAVLDAAGEIAHVVAHDWGSVQTWAALADPRVAGRIASFTSISGPSLEHTAAWLRRAHQHPLGTARQLAASYYTMLFQLPHLPEAAIRAGLLDRAIGRRARADQLNGLNLYRANLGTMRRREPARIEVPVQVIAPDRDRYITPQLAFGAPRPYVAQLQTQSVRGGHWVVSERCDVIADHVREFALRHRPRARAQ